MTVIPVVLVSTGVSLMPDGLEKNIPPQQMADLIAFIKYWRYFDEPLLPQGARSVPGRGTVAGGWRAKTSPAVCYDLSSYG